VSFTAASTFSSSCRLHFVFEHFLSRARALAPFLFLHHEHRWRRIWPRHRKRAGHRVHAVETRPSQPPSSAMATTMARCLHPRPVSQNKIITQIHLIYFHAPTSNSPTITIKRSYFLPLLSCPHYSISSLPCGL